MKIEDILKKQGEIYKNLTSNETIREYNKTINTYGMSEQEHKAIKGLEKLLGEKPAIVDKPESWPEINFKISIEKNKITYLCIDNRNLTKIPKQMNDLKNLKRLNLNDNKITKIENLDNLPNLQTLDLYNNQISKLENLDNLPNLQILWLYSNQISKLENLDNLPNLKELYIHYNQIQKLENLDNLPNLQILDLDSNQIQKLENLDNLPNLQRLWLHSNPIKNKEEIKNLRKKGIDV